MTDRGVRHGFSTRLGGVSRGPYATMNLGLDVDEREAVLENRRRFALLLGVEEIVQVDQVHGARIIDEADAAGAEADGLISRSRPVGVRTADCAPVLISTDDGETVAAVHAGWRGAVAGILPAAVERFGSTELAFAIGPTICVDCFEVGAEVIEAAARSLGGETPPMTTKAKPHLDLVGLLERQLARVGVSPDRVERVGGCTFHQGALFFSHRRDRGVTGRQLSAIAPCKSRDR